MSKETLTKSIREIPDFPIPGILFYDVTTLFKEPTALQELSDTLYAVSYTHLTLPTNSRV